MDDFTRKFDAAQDKDEQIHFILTSVYEALTVECSPALLEYIPADSREGLLGVLAGDPRPRYQEDPQRVYGLSFAGYDIRFTVEGDRLTVIAVE